MIVRLFHIANLAVLLSGLWAYRLRNTDSAFSLSLIQIMACLPLLAAEYFYAACHSQPEIMPLILFSENVFAFVWCVSAYRLYHIVTGDTSDSRLFSVFGILAGAAILGVTGFSFFGEGVAAGKDGLVFPHYGTYFFCSIFLLFSALAMVWRLEQFWRGLSVANRREYEFLVIGESLVCGAMAWSVSYRLTFLRLSSDHFALLSALLLLGWLMVVYAAARYRLLNRTLFVSRKVVYAFVAPLIFGLYLIALGLIVLMMRFLGLSLPVVLYWLLFAAGLTVLTSLCLSDNMRQKVRFFISTHFYINKYEYRDQWLAFSRLLRGSLTETEILDALYRILSASLYTDTIFIWHGDDRHGYRIAFPKESLPENKTTHHLSPRNPLVSYLENHARYHIGEKGHEEAPPEMIGLFTELNIVLAVPLTTGEQMLGFVALGAEFAGGSYGADDYDLLTAIGTQAASALLAARMADELSRTRQQEAWNIMSAFVLHDVKNAAGMLSLIRQNAPAHIRDPEFQQDMLDTIDDSLKRMAKVQDRLNALKGEITPMLREVCLCRTLTEGCRKLKKRLPGLKVDIRHDGQIRVKTDPELLLRIIENLLINSMEAGAGEIMLGIGYVAGQEHRVAIELTDNGPGLPGELLPNGIFEPFRTTKPKGTGIGLWYVRQIVICLGGAIMAENKEDGGACFLITLPTE